MAKRKPDGRTTRQPVAVPSPAARNYPDVATPEKIDALERKSRWLERGVVGAVCALVIGVYAYTAHEGAITQPSRDAAGSYYNLLVQGFRAGQLNLKKEVPIGLAQLADPYAPTPLRPLGVMDLSYYRGKLYLYFGVTPAVVLFWPYVALTGHFLSTKDAALFFCIVGFLVSAGLLCGMWRRYFEEVSVGVVAAGTLALGLAPFIPSLLARCDVWEVPISCGYMLTMLALAAMWKALHDPKRRGWWLAAASLAYGLAVGARPNLLFGGVLLLIPVAQAWRERLVARTRHERRQIWFSLLAVTVPITLIGLGLMLYNVRRFDDPLEFGIRYAVTLQSQLHEQLFNWHHFWLNFRVYFLAPAHWSGRFPFVHHVTHLPAGDAFGVLANIPLAWLALATPLAWRGRPGSAGSVLRWFVMAAAVLFGMCALTLGLYYLVALRYEVDFLPALVLLAVIGILSLERVLASQPLRRRVVRLGWSILLGFSVVFSVLASVERCAEADNDLGMQQQGAGQAQEASWYYEQALRLYPDFADAHINLGNALMQTGRIQEGMGHYEEALRIKPDSFKGHNDFGVALAQLGRMPEAIAHYEQALRIKPDSFEAQYNLGNLLARTGEIEEAIAHYEEALRIKPDYAEAHNNLGAGLFQSGTTQEAIGHYEQALRLKPDFVEAHCNLGNALVQTGRVQDGISHYEQALRIKPDYAEAHNNLGATLEQAGRLQEAVGHYEQALRIKPDYAAAQDHLARARAAQ